MDTRKFSLNELPQNILFVISSIQFEGIQCIIIGLPQNIPFIISSIPIVQNLIIGIKAAIQVGFSNTDHRFGKYNILGQFINTETNDTNFSKTILIKKSWNIVFSAEVVLSQHQLNIHGLHYVTVGIP